MSVDWGAIAAAIATRFSASNITPPAGEANIRLSTHRLPNQLGPGHAVLVFPPESVTFNVASSSRTSLSLWPVRFYLYQLKDTKRNMDSLYAWMNVLYQQLDAQVHLGLAPVVERADVMSPFRAGILEYPQGGDRFYGIELAVQVRTFEAPNFIA